MRVPLVLLGVAGVALYGSYSHFSAPSGRLAQLAQVSEIVTGAPAATTMTDVPLAQPRIYSPHKPLMGAIAEAVSKPLVPPAPTPVIRRSDPFGEPPAVRAVQPKVTAPAAAVTAAPATTSAAGRKSTAGPPASEEARVVLVRDLQRELKRVGCFEGELSGWWNQASRRAMSAFTNRVNASLPVDEPDYILLALVQGYAGQACGAGCPAGQALANDGRCIPKAIQAQADRKGGRIETAATRKEAPRESAADSDRRMQLSAAALAGQLAASTGAPRVKNWETGVFPTAPQAHPAARLAPPVPAAIAAASSEPLPGRMSIGAPANLAQPDLHVSPPATTGSLPTAPEVTTKNWSSPGLSGSSSSAPKSGPPAKRVARAEYQSAPRVYYASPPPSRPRSGSSLRGSQGVKDFFYGAGRGSF